MLIDKKLYDLIEYFIELKDSVTVTKIAKELDQNRRVIYYNLEKINFEIEKDRLCDKIQNASKLGISIDNKQKDYLRGLISNYENNNYFLSVEERQLFISILICTYPDKVIIELLMEMCSVSRNTIVNDLKDIKNNIEKTDFNLSLSVNKKSGYFINGDELVKIQYLYSLLNELYSYKNEKLKYKINSALYKNNIMFGTSFYITLSSLIENNLYIIGKEITFIEKKKFIFTFPYLVMSYKKSINGINLDNHNIIKERLEYKFIDKILFELNNIYDLEFSEEEQIILATIVLCLKKDSDIHNSSSDYEDLRENLSTFVDIFEKNSAVYFESKNKLIDRLITHFKTLLFRKKYNIVTNNSLTDTIINKYKDVYLITKQSIKYLESMYSLKFTNSEISYISLHFGAELLNSKQKINTIKKALIVTSEQYSIRKLLVSQCKYYLTNCNIVGVTNEEDYNNYTDIDFIITTNPIDSKVPNVLVSPLITTDDINKIIKFTQNMNYNYLNTELQESIINVLKEYLSDDTLKEVNEKIKKLVQ
ncbi:BglG family transcription antiterminator [Gemelliphila palaticanis]|uniref:PRD domain-containing protein n=1 Tax=Gemelliphila palaticanis TaxID=81950 RepID=A0ABX2SZL2_9BACL|nr:PRD domain-containing protein [Gemella palaticanis]MBF0714684.1 PRD domain-containing protein [Gemella palaticanis]NYS46614.1 PRD domain-containing protein [Gemella palaticanis]